MKSFEMDSIYLRVPEYNELWYRRKIMADPQTMSYNKGYELVCDGYDNKTGCIDFPESKWKEWYDFFVCGEPSRFYAFVVKKDETFIGEVCLRKVRDKPYYDMGIVIESEFRGNGYSVEALKLLLKYAFEKLGAEAVHNEFEETRTAANRLHLSAGFKKTGCKNGICEYLITKEQYFS